MSSDEILPPDQTPNIPDSSAGNPELGPRILEDGTRLIQLSINEELRGSYLTYAMSVIVSRAIPDVRDGLKPSQRRILVAMNDLNLGPTASRAKCAKIAGETMGTYHPHGDAVIYPTLVRMAQDWNSRYVLVDKQGNFGSISGLPPGHMRYTEARMASVAAMMLEDLNLDTVDFIPTYDEQRMEPTVLPSKFPNLLANGSNGIAVGMATSIPPHNVAEVCDATIAVLDDPGISPLDLLKICPGPDFPTGGIICGRSGIARGYLTGRGNVVLRAKATIEENNKKSRIIISEIPYQQTRDRVEEKISEMANSGKIVGITAVHNQSDLKEPVRLVIDLKRDADPEVVLNQLYQYTMLQDSFSIIMLALVDGKPRILTFKEMAEEFIRHRISVIRRRTQFLLNKARRQKHRVEGLIIAHANIDEVIRTIRSSATQAEAKSRLMLIECPSSMLQRALGDEGYEIFQKERGVAETYTLTPVQADAILRMTLGQLVNLEQERLGEEYRNLLVEIAEYLKILADEGLIRDMIRDDLNEVKRKHGDKRRTEITGEEAADIDVEDLINEETMVVSISTDGYIKRTPVSVYRAQRRGGKGRIGAKVADEDPIQHLFVSSTHNYLLFFTNKGRVHWEKVYNLPQGTPTSKGRAIVNMLNLSEGEKIADCRPIRDFDEPDHYLVLATKNGLVKKTALSAFRRPTRAGLNAIKLREGDELIDTTVVGPGDELIISSAQGNAIRFRHTDVRAMGRTASGVKGIRFRKGDYAVGMVIASPDMTLLTACANGYGKRTAIGPNAEPEEEEPPMDGDVEAPEIEVLETEESEKEIQEKEFDGAEDIDDSEDSGDSSSKRYTTKRRGGLGLKDIRTTKRNGSVVSITRVRDDDEVMMITAKGQIQRIAVRDVTVQGRNTQGVRLMNLDDDDTLVTVKRIPRDANAVIEPVNDSSEVSDEAGPAHFGADP